MSRHDDEALRSAFQGLAESSRLDCPPDELERIWRAVGGELPAVERREIVERLASEPAYAEAWRIAHDLRRDIATMHVQQTRSRWRPAAWMGAAAALVVAVAAAIVLRVDGPDEAVFRNPGESAVESLLPADAVLPRTAFRLRWTPGPDGSRYLVRVTAEDLRLITTAGGLSQAEYEVPTALLAGTPPGSRVLWQVEVTLPDGERAVSSTFVSRVE